MKEKGKNAVVVFVFQIVFLKTLKILKERILKHLEWFRNHSSKILWLLWLDIRVEIVFLLVIVDKLRIANYMTKLTWWKWLLVDNLFSSF